MKYSVFKSEGVWKFFLRSDDKVSAQCTLCPKVIKVTGGCTKGLHSHMEHCHSKALKDWLDEQERAKCHNAQKPGSGTCGDGQPPKKVQKTMTQFFSPQDDETVGAVISRMVAKDGLPLSVFVTSKDLRKLLVGKGFSVPTSKSTIKAMINSYAIKIKAIVSADIQASQKCGKKLSITLDEYTSLKNRRYMNVNVHSVESCWNLGLIRIVGSMSAQSCFQLLTSKLDEFNISIQNDVIGVTTDGPSIMVRFGTFFEAEHQLCLAHAVQLAVIDVFYKPGSACYSPKEKPKNNPENCSSNDSLESDLEEPDSGDEDLRTSYVENEQPTLKCDTEFLIQKVRKTVRLFRKSPVKCDELLYKYTQLEFGKDIVLLLDCKTRWSSLFTMLERFLQLKNCIEKAVIDVKCKKIMIDNFTTVEWEKIEEIVLALRPLKLAVEALCRSDSSLLTADTILRFALNQLFSLKSETSDMLHASLLIRIGERRRLRSDVLQYLHNSVDIKPEMDALYRSPASFLAMFCYTLLERVEEKQTETPGPRTVNEEQSLPTTGQTQAEDKESENSTWHGNDLKEALQSAIDATKMNRGSLAKDETFSLQAAIKSDITAYQQSGNLDNAPNLKKVYNHLLSIQPTSVEAERIFSSTTYICTKLRSSMSDSTLDSVVFLRSYFQRM